MTTYLTWWQGGLLLAAITISFQLLLRKGLGISTSWTSLTFWRETRKRYDAQKTFDENSENVRNDFTRMTLEQFGEHALLPTSQSEKPPIKTVYVAPWGVHFAFLLSIIVGALLVSLYDGSFSIKFELSEFHSKLSGQGWALLNTLFIGGLLVGFGTQMAGGCTSGHGLSGCANFAWPSLVSILTVLLSASLLAILVQSILI